MAEFMNSDRYNQGRDALNIGKQTGRSRLDNIDLVRGLVIVIMALDHVKGNFSNAHFDLVDLSRTTEAYFLTRWISHFCAPIFVFLAGTGAFLYGARGRSKNELAWFLVSRGIWLIFLELTWIRFSWFLDVGYAFSFGQVIWAIGWGMIIMAPLIYLPLSFIAVLGLGMILFHNHFDGVPAESWGKLDWLWSILHTGEHIVIWTDDGALHIELMRTLREQGIQQPPGPVFHPFYPLIPWIGVMFAGYAFGALMLLDRPQRRSQVFALGLGLTLMFLALRYSNVYGDKISTNPALPGPWSEQKDLVFTAFSFVNTQKYPPSLVFLLMTLGPGLMALALFDREPGPLSRFFVTFGRVPLFFYLLHWYLIKGLAIAFAQVRYGRIDWLVGGDMTSRPQSPSDNGYDLWVIYVVWIGVVLALFPFCYWFAGVKMRSRSAWLSYL
ncbi:MAG: DUF1624 domain-containing protein [Planctomycetes bacterium]|nr:DUF1624 domain-containing protein [Planctomycetota bacterium]